MYYDGNATLQNVPFQRTKRIDEYLAVSRRINKVFTTMLKMCAIKGMEELNTYYSKKPVKISKMRAGSADCSSDARAAAEALFIGKIIG